MKIPQLFQHTHYENGMNRQSLRDTAHKFIDEALATEGLMGVVLITVRRGTKHNLSAIHEEVLTQLREAGMPEDKLPTVEQLQKAAHSGDVCVLGPSGKECMMHTLAESILEASHAELHEHEDHPKH